MCRFCFVAYADGSFPRHGLCSNRTLCVRDWLAHEDTRTARRTASVTTTGCGRLRLALPLLLAWLVIPHAWLYGWESPSAPPCGAAKLPVQIIEKPAQRLEAETTPSPAAQLRLQPPSRREGNAESRFRAPTAGSAATTVITSLAVVLGLFLLSALVLRKTTGRHHATLPGEVVQTLGRAPLNGRQEMHLVRVGNKLLLLSVTATGAETLTEITEPEEIDRLAGICRQSHPDSITASFREILWQCGQTPRV
jgi:flagellar biogenesis protein FliO